MGPDATPRETIHAVLTELLPLDEQRREEVIVLGAFATAAIAGRGITAEETFAAPQALAGILTDQLRRTRRFGRSGPNAPERDAELITMTIGGLAQAMLQNFITPQSALEVIDHLLDRVLGTNTADTDSSRSASN
ncbi:TetR family transcriptional regulator C-terminal domain-containing protein [Nocardia abscessus]|uniref:TetR family transcriptional regulator C-terminal domain-containing protein n=1 Tax=Nocardia abscessus TaxID=120957 RepID=UPI002455796B|nr:TetR family transcriptional regulator C-terminal domain-containing protein [Nocardia abscessus]